MLDQATTIAFTSCLHSGVLHFLVNRPGTAQFKGITVID